MSTTTPAVPTADLPSQILGVKRTVTKTQAMALFAAGDVQYLRGMLAVKFLQSRGKGKTVREIADDLGITRSKVQRAGSAAALVWQIGEAATDADAKNALALVNAVDKLKGRRIGDYFDGEAEGIDARKALAAAARAARADTRKAIAAPEQAEQGEQVEQVEQAGTPQPRSAVDTSTVTVTADDASRVKGSAAMLANVTSECTRVSPEDAETLLAHALRIAIVVLPAETVSDTIAGALDAQPAPKKRTRKAASK